MLYCVMKRDQLIALIAAEEDARRHGRGPVEIDGWPDEDDRTGKAVDFTGHDKFYALVVEHTRIESYPNEISELKTMESIFPRLGPLIVGRNDAGRYGLWVRPGALNQIGFNDRSRVEQAITEWVTNCLDDVPYGKVRYGEHPDVPFTWALAHFLPDDIGLVGPDASVVRIRHFRSDDLEDHRRIRAEKVVATKLAKLAAAREKGRRRSLLVLEDKDQQLSAPLLVSRALEASVGNASLPDAVYTFYQGGGDPLIGLLYEEGTWAHSDQADFHWLSVERHRCADLRAIPTPWM
jgi:hypothetical protein